MAKIIVTAKDSSGNAITNGGEAFLLKVSNAWTIKNIHYCEVNSSTFLTSNIYVLMTDHNNGTYSASYTINSGTGKIKAIKF